MMLDEPVLCRCTYSEIMWLRVGWIASTGQTQAGPQDFVISTTGLRNIYLCRRRCAVRLAGVRSSPPEGATAGGRTAVRSRLQGGHGFVASACALICGTSDPQGLRAPRPLEDERFPATVPTHLILPSGILIRFQDGWNRIC